jgi:hypothetical protein
VIAISSDPRTYSLSIEPGDPICFNSTDVGAHFLDGESFNSTFTFFNATDSSTIAHRSTSAWLSFAISSVIPENITFTTATFPNSCTLGFFYSNSPNSELFLPNNTSDVIQDYDDRCFLVHAYHDSNVTASWDTELGHDFVVLNQNEAEQLSGIGSRTFSGRPVSLRFTSDFAGLSNFVGIKSASNVINPHSGSGQFPKFRPLVPSKTMPKKFEEGQSLSLAMIIGICSGVVAVLGSILTIVIYRLCRPVKDDIGHFNAEIIEARTDVRVQSLVDSEDHSQSDDVFTKPTDIVSPIM